MRSIKYKWTEYGTKFKFWTQILFINIKRAIYLKHILWQNCNEHIHIYLFFLLCTLFIDMSCGLINNNLYTNVSSFAWQPHVTFGFKCQFYIVVNSLLCHPTPMIPRLEIYILCIFTSNKLQLYAMKIFLECHLTFQSWHWTTNVHIRNESLKVVKFTSFRLKYLPLIPSVYLQWRIDKSYSGCFIISLLSLHKCRTFYILYM